MPPLRLAIIDHLATHPGDALADVRRALGKPRTTVHRRLQSIHMLGVLSLDEIEGADAADWPTTRWRYSLADGIEPASLTCTSPDLSPHAHGAQEERQSPFTDISGDVAEMSRTA